MEIDTMSHVVFFAADPRDRQQALEHTFAAITNQQPVAPATLTVQMGRKLQVDKAGRCLLPLSTHICNTS